MHITNDKPFAVFDASAYRVGIVVAKFNEDITSQLVASAQEKLREYHVASDHVDVYQVAGSVEIPVILQTLAQSKKYQCLIALGAVIRGETPHFDYVAKIVSEGVLRVMLDNNIPIGFGVLTTENLHQAQERVGSGGGAAVAALHSAKILETC